MREIALFAMHLHCESTTDLSRTLDQSCFIIQSCKAVMGQSTPALGAASATDLPLCDA